METAILVLCILIAILLIILVIRSFMPSSDRHASDFQALVDDIRNSVITSEKETKSEISESINNSITVLGNLLANNQDTAGRAQSEKLSDMESRINKTLESVISSLSAQSEALSKDFTSLGNVLTESRKNSDETQRIQLENIGNNTGEKLETLEKRFKALEESNESKLDAMRKTIESRLDNNLNSLSKVLTDNQKQASEAQFKQIDTMSRSVTDKQDISNQNINERLLSLESRFKALEESNNKKMEEMRSTMEKQLDTIREDNNKKLGEIQSTVNEKLETKMTESFKLVSEQLERVYTGLGEMQNIAANVGDLKKVLSNVKTRGTLGEIQLGAILQEILAAEQYDVNVRVDPEKSEVVEFAVKLPGNDGEHIYLPIDSKFPGDTYAALQEAFESGDKNRIDTAKKQLYDVIKKCAKDIKEKYIVPPYTTGFAIMFLPFEGLYAEVANSGMIETLQREYNVNVAGPSTMAAILNSFQMGFRTLAIQKKSSEVWRILSAVKTEFTTFEGVLTKTRDSLRKADESLDKLVGTRTRQMMRKLGDVETVSLNESRKLLGIQADEDMG